ncbi:PilX N-terminal domain-containing pilus assembly protein [Cupriavidus plantarum]|nr:type IV pilus assembly protein PilX [Cupriavidus plantarum]CAG2127553.1 hypothetical protein LMG26296_00592 [Cupriavidus plantarum]SMR67269.1 type IV pilus assembly protein PilX [Cupriavidus plantarum]
MVLLFLVILTLAGVAASISSRSSELMARNARDENIALQAAESALRDARNDIMKKRLLKGLTGASDTCDTPGYKGYCTEPSSGQPRWQQYIEDPARSVELGEITELTAAQKMPTTATVQSNGVWRQPRYIIEPTSDLNSGDDIKFNNIKYVFRVTAIGYGANPTTRVIVQEVVRL